MDREDQEPPDRDLDDDWAGDPAGGPLRGWIPPDDRLWRHPSEAGAGTGGIPSVPDQGLGLPRGRTTTWIIGGATACFLIALVAAGFAVSATGGDDGASGTPAPMHLNSAPTTEVGAATVVAASKVDTLVDAVEPSTVALRVERAGSATVATGLVAMPGGIIVTTASAVEGARSITVTEPGGTSYPGTLVATDAPTGLAVVRIAEDLPVFPFDQTEPDVGGWGVAMSLVASGRHGARPVADVYAGAITSITPVGHRGLSTIDASLPLGSVDVGCPLIDPDGDVVGVLESVRRSDGSQASAFLPAQLVLHVVEQLVESGKVDQGWLGIDVRSAPGSAASPAGALVVAVAPGGPAATGGLADGDVITGVDGIPVGSPADLMTDLYALGPDTPVNLDYSSPTAGFTYASVVLASDDTDAPVLSASP